MATKDDLTPRENEVLALAWQCFEAEPKVCLPSLTSLFLPHAAKTINSHVILT
jgi:hypothetical protein